MTCDSTTRDPVCRGRLWVLLLLILCGACEQKPAPFDDLIPIPKPSEIGYYDSSGASAPSATASSYSATNANKAIHSNSHKGP